MQWNQRSRRKLVRHIRVCCVVGAVAFSGGCASHSNNSFRGWNPIRYFAGPAPATETKGSEPSVRMANKPQLENQANQSEIALVSYNLLQVAAPDVVETEIATARFRLEDLESIAIENSPTVQQLQLSASKAAGFRTQVSLKPNPTLGYSGQQLADMGTEQHTAVVEREVVTGDKLLLNRNVLNGHVRRQLRELETQKIRVLTDVRVAYFQLLAARRKERMLAEFEQASKRAVELTELRKNAKEGSQIDVLQATTQWNQVQLLRQQAIASLDSLAKQLASLTGLESILPSEVDGLWEPEQVSVDWPSFEASLREQNPQFQVAQANLERSWAALQRQQAQAIPNVAFQLGAGKDQGTNSGMINTQMSIPIPVHNRNQGNIAAANADYCMARLELDRIERSLRNSIATLYGDYESARLAVQLYRTTLIPDNQKTLELANQAYVAGETSFLEVLIIRRTYFEVQLQSIDAERDLLLAKARLDGFGLTGAFDPIDDSSGDSSLRDQSFSQQ